MKIHELYPQHVLITRLSAIGDCILTIPLAVAVKRLWPNCKVTWAVQCSAASLLTEHPAVDSVFKIEASWLRSFQGLRKLRNILREQRFDLAFDPQGLTKSAIVGWLSGASHRIGFDRSHAREISPWLYSMRVRRRQRHMVDVYRELLTPFQVIDRSDAQFDMPTYTDAAAIAQRILIETKLVSPWFCINVGAGWPSKIWPVDRYCKLARQLFDNTGYPSLVVWAGEAERAIASHIVQTQPNCCIMAPPTNLQVLAELLRCSLMYVGGDTGPMHLAAAVGTPCVALFGPTWADECGPYGLGHVAIQSPIAPKQNSSMRHADNSAMQAISVDEVADGCLRILQSTSTHAAA